MEIREYFRALRSHWYVVVAGALVCLTVAALYLIVRPPSYTSTAQAYVATQATSSISDLNQGADFAQQTVASFAGLATSSYVLSPVIDQANLRVTPEDLSHHVSATTEPGTALLDVSVTTRSASESERVANLIVQRLEVAVAQLSTGASASTDPLFQLSQVNAASTPQPGGPSVALILALGFIIGGALGYVGAVLTRAISKRVRTLDEFSASAHLPVLANLRTEQRTKQKTILDPVNGSDRRREAFDLLRTNLRFLRVDDKSHAYVVTSSIAGEGKTTTAINLAVSLSAAGVKTLLVDADLRRPEIATRTGLYGGVGFTDVVSGEVPLNQAIQEWGPSRLHVLPAGSRSVSPVDIVQSNSVEKLLRSLAASYRYVIVDSPPIMAGPDAAILGRAATGLIMVVGLNRVKSTQIRRALGRIQQMGAGVVGLVGNFSTRIDTEEGYYQYGSTDEAMRLVGADALASEAGMH